MADIIPSTPQWWHKVSNHPDMRAVATGPVGLRWPVGKVKDVLRRLFNQD